MLLTKKTTVAVEATRSTNWFDAAAKKVSNFLKRSMKILANWLKVPRRRRSSNWSMSC